VQVYVHRDGRPVGRATLWGPPALRRLNLGGEPDGALVELSISASGEGARSQCRGPRDRAAPADAASQRLQRPSTKTSARRNAVARQFGVLRSA
jgi:hypothetical protein